MWGFMSGAILSMMNVLIREYVKSYASILLRRLVF